MKKFLTLFCILVLFQVPVILEAKTKIKFTPNLTGAFKGTYDTGGTLEFIKGDIKYTGNMTFTGSSTKKVKAEIAIGEKKLTYEATVVINMVDVGVMVKTALEDLKITYGDLNLSGTIIKNEFGKVKMDLKFGDKKVTGNPSWGKYDYDFSGTKISGTRKGLTGIEFDFKIGDKKILGAADIDLKLIKKTLNIDYNFKIDDLTDEETALFFTFTVLSEVFSGRAN